MKRGVLAVAALCASLLPRTVGAEVAGPLDFSPDQARAAFVDAGYGVEASVTGTTFRVYNHVGDRVLLVTVYRDAQQAQTGLHQTDASASTWIHNLTLVESTADDSIQSAAAIEAVDADFVAAVFAGPLGNLRNSDAVLASSS